MHLNILHRICKTIRLPAGGLFDVSQTVLVKRNRCTSEEIAVKVESL